MPHQGGLTPETLFLMPHKKQTAGVILAAGMSLRFGRPKQLLELGSKYLLEWVLDAALASRLAKVALVLGHEHQKILQILGAKTSLPRLQILINRRYQEGQSRSLQAGLSSVQKAFDSVMFLLGDQPRLQSATIDHLLTSFWDSDKNICVPVYRGKRANPTIFSRALYGKLMTIEGDIGARNIILENPDQVLSVEINDPLDIVDIDSQEDLACLQNLLLNSHSGINTGKEK
jgi:molybdenum cofactor cytidylyltransferase